MIPEMLWIVGFYVAAAAVAHSVLGRHPAERRRHYVLVAGNHQLQIEWYIRALQHFSLRTGTDIGITVVLDRSSDETGPILERFARQSEGIGWIRSDEADENPEQVQGFSRGWILRQMEEQGMFGPPQQVVWVDLGKCEDLTRLPI